MVVVVGYSTVGGGMGLGLGCSCCIVVDGLAWVRLNDTIKDVLGFGSPGEDFPSVVHFETNPVAAVVMCEGFVGGAEVLVVGIVGDSGSLHCSQTVVLEVGDYPQVLSATVVMEEVSGMAERLQGSVSRIPEAKVVVAGVFHFSVEV